MFCSIYISFFSAFFNLYGIRLASILSAITFPLIEIENISHERTFLCYDDITEIMLKIIEVQNPNFRMVIMNLVINFLFHFTFIFKHILSCLMYHFFFYCVQVNGQDLSQSTHEEAVEAFRSAKEPIVVEVLRRANKAKMKSRSPTMVSVGTQTEEEIFCSNESPPTPPPGFYAFNGSG